MGDQPKFDRRMVRGEGSHLVALDSLRLSWTPLALTWTHLGLIGFVWTHPCLRHIHDPPTLLGVERARLQWWCLPPPFIHPASRRPAIQPATIRLACQPQGLSMVYIGATAYCHRPPQLTATGRHRLPKGTTGRHRLPCIQAPEYWNPSQMYENTCKSIQLYINTCKCMYIHVNPFQIYENPCKYI